MIFIDANIFLEVQLRQSSMTECKQLLEFLEESKHLAWTNSFLVFSMILIIQKKVGDITKAKKLVIILSSYSGLRVFSPRLSTILQALVEQKKNRLDFDDGLVVACMKELQITDIVTFDNHFNEIQGINKLSPSEALAKLSRV